LDYWKTTSEVIAEFNHDIRQPKREGYDRFNFNIKLADQANLEAKTMFFCVKYTVNGKEYWDNNNSTNYQVDFKKKAKPQTARRVCKVPPQDQPILYPEATRSRRLNDPSLCPLPLMTLPMDSMPSSRWMTSSNLYTTTSASRARLD